MTENEIKRIVSESVRETLLTLGIDAEDPLEIQADMQHLRSWRRGTDTIKKQSLITAVGIITAGFIGLVYSMMKG